jgi:hypothetical protein
MIIPPRQIAGGLGEYEKNTGLDVFAIRRI